MSCQSNLFEGRTVLVTGGDCGRQAPPVRADLAAQPGFTPAADHTGTLLTQAVTALATTLHIPDFVARSSTEDRGGDWQLPAYAHPSAGQESQPRIR